MVISLSKLRLDPLHIASCYMGTAAQVALVLNICIAFLTLVSLAVCGAHRVGPAGIPEY